MFVLGMDIFFLCIYKVNKSSKSAKGFGNCTGSPLDNLNYKKRSLKKWRVKRNTF